MHMMQKKNHVDALFHHTLVRTHLVNSRHTSHRFMTQRPTCWTQVRHVHRSCRCLGTHYEKLEILGHFLKGMCLPVVHKAKTNWRCVMFLYARAHKECKELACSIYLPRNLFAVWHPTKPYRAWRPHYTSVVASVVKWVLSFLDCRRYI